MRSSAPPCLPAPEFLDVVRLTPLISIDLIVVDDHARVLLGRRVNRPALGAWFVPGGRIHKDESLGGAFSRIVREELGLGEPDAEYGLLSRRIRTSL